MTVTDPEAHEQAIEEVSTACAQRDCEATIPAAAFQRDSSQFSNLVRYETSIERSLYKALHELQRLQAARAGRKVIPPVAVDVNVDSGEGVA